MESIIEITGCRNKCKFFKQTVDGMECGHVHWDHFPGKSHFVISFKNSFENNIPEQCPLKTEDLVITYKLKEQKRFEPSIQKRIFMISTKTPFTELAIQNFILSNSFPMDDLESIMINCMDAGIKDLWEVKIIQSSL